jgi:hypothetical protein
MKEETYGRHDVCSAADECEIDEPDPMNDDDADLIDDEECEENVLFRKSNYLNDITLDGATSLNWQQESNEQQLDEDTDSSECDKTNEDIDYIKDEKEKRLNSENNPVLSASSLCSSSNQESQSQLTKINYSDDEHSSDQLNEN